MKQFNLEPNFLGIKAVGKQLDILRASNYVELKISSKMFEDFVSNDIEIFFPAKKIPILTHFDRDYEFVIDNNIQYGKCKITEKYKTGFFTYSATYPDCSAKFLAENDEHAKRLAGKYDSLSKIVETRVVEVIEL